MRLLRIAFLLVTITLSSCDGRELPVRPHQSATTEESAVEAPAAVSVSATAAWRPFTEAERRELCSKRTKRQRAGCNQDFGIEEMLIKECAFDSPMWRCPNVSAADLEACWLVESPKDDISNGCKALDLKIKACGADQRIREQCPVLITKVLPDSPAAKAGIVAGDRITEIDGKPFGAIDDLAATVHGAEGAPQRIRVRHASEGEGVVSVAAKKDERGRFKIGVSFDRPPECPYLNTSRVLPCRID